MALRLTIEGLVYGGSGIGRAPNGKVVFVPYTVPGEVCTVEVTEDRRDFSKARLLSIDEPSPIRVEPFCPLFTKCGGCHLQHLPYEAQLEWKTKIFQETIARATDLELVPQAIPAENATGYRAKATFHVEGGKAGFFRASSHSVVELEECPLLMPSINKTLKEIKESLPEAVHTIDVAVDVDTDKTTAIFYTEDAGCKLDIPHSTVLKGYEVRVKRRFQRGRGRLLYRRGETDCSYTVEGIRLLYSSSVFFQVNPAMNRRLVQKVVEAVGKDVTVVDAFCGAGNFSLPVAKKGCRVEGFDIDGVAIEYAKRAAGLNSIEGAVFFPLDVERGKVLEKIAPSVVVLDPPRGGCRGLATEVAERAVERVVYVSCNPSTLGRDLKEFLERGYRVVSSTLVDMFPQTYHVESITVLTL